MAEFFGTKFITLRLASNKFQEKLTTVRQSKPIMQHIYWVYSVWANFYIWTLKRGKLEKVK